MFQSTAAVRVVRHQTDLEQLPANAPAGLDAAVFLQNEAAIIGSDTILQKTIERLALNQEWGKRFNDGQPLKTHETVARLKPRLQVSPEPGTALLRTSSSPVRRVGASTSVCVSSTIRSSRF
jgi:uncharacterized protein involved in exopolysaccharide biosynthesis